MSVMALTLTTSPSTLTNSNVVMFSKNYATPWYWEMLARGFKKLLKKPFYISLYVYGPGDNPKDVPTPAEF